MAPPASNASTPTAGGGTVLDPSTRRLARVYAEALLRRVDGPDAREQLTRELEGALDAMAQVEGFEALFTQNLVRRGELRDMIRRVFAGRCSDDVFAYLCLLASRGKGALLRPTVQRLRELRDERAGRQVVEVITAVPLSDERQGEVKRHLAQSLGIRPMLRLRVDPSLMGGMIVRVGEKQYDASTASKLRAITRRIEEKFARDE